MWWLIPWLLFLVGLAAILLTHMFKRDDQSASVRRRS
jgi:hypothetical protein